MTVVNIDKQRALITISLRHAEKPTKSFAAG
jgi:hypothetical protein